MLNVNHRSTQAIVAAQMRLIRNNYAPYGGPYEARYQKRLSPNGRAAYGVPVSWNWHDTDEAEATWLASKVGSYVSVGRSPGEIFVGARTRAQLGLVEVALAERQVGYINIAGGSFWVLPHVTQAVAYLALACAEWEGDAGLLGKVLHLPSDAMPDGRRLGKQFMEACGKAGWRGAGDAARANPMWKDGVEDIRQVLAGIRKRAVDSIGLALRYVLDECIYPALDRATPVVDGGISAADDEMSELEVLVRIGAKHPTLQSFITYARGMQRRAQAEQMTDNRVVLSTIHRLKGQERAIVFGVGWCEGTVPLRRDGETVEQPIGYLPHGRALQSDAKKGLADERCLAFVLISRARELCHLSGFAVAQGGRTLKPSRFIEEALG